MALPLRREARWVFIGDSITDCSRKSCPEGIGSGYVRLIRDYLAARDPLNAPAVQNAGVSGNTVRDLGPRWESDLLAHNPDLVSVKIGINDVWRSVVAIDLPGVPLDVFRQEYTRLLTDLRARLPECTLVLCEPSVIEAVVHPDGNAALKPYVAAVSELAEEFQARTVVPLHQAFESATAQRPDISWTTDGVHPTSAGHMLIARHWLAALGLL